MPAQPSVQREDIPEEEEALQTKALGHSVQREAIPEEEEDLQMKPLATTITPLVQREALPEEEELQTKPLSGSIQREALPEEEELQTKPLSGSIQREALPEEEEELQTKSLDNSIQRETLPEDEELQMKALGTATLQREAMPEEDEELQTKRSPTPHSPLPTPSLESRLTSSLVGGSPLPDDVRAFMEPRFGADFSQVRVHTGNEAVQMNQDLNAQAFTHKQDVYFGAGKSPGNDALTAHELTHTIQQGGGTAHPLMRESQDRFGVLVQCKDQDPDELAATAKEDASIEAKAKSALQSKNLHVDVPQIIWRLIQSHRLDTNRAVTGVGYEKMKKGIELKLSGKEAGTQGSIVAGDDVLQRIANGQSAQVVKEIEAQIGKVSTVRGTIDYVFIMGVDNPKKNNPFYAEAKKFFKAEYSNAVMVEDVRTLEGINQRVNDGGKPVANLYIVSHANADGTLSFSLNSTDKTPGQVQYSEINEANKGNSLTKPGEKLVGFWTNVMLRGCNLGRSKKMLNELKSTFGGKANVMAPTHEQGYGNGKESMAGPFYEEPGKSKLNNNEAFEKIKSKSEYAFITSWKAMRNTLKRVDDFIPEQVYNAQFPVKGKEMEFLKSMSGAAEAKKFTFGQSTTSGNKTTLTYLSKNPTQYGNLTISDLDIPPNEKDAIAQAREASPRPDAYAYKVRTQRNGAVLQIFVDAQRTEWQLYHANIHKQGKGFNPSPGTKPWFGNVN
ncbi:MAG: DUF4157 domain-containing protein [Stenomitos frigidus ULC029]